MTTNITLLEHSNLSNTKAVGVTYIGVEGNDEESNEERPESEKENVTLHRLHLGQVVDELKDDGEFGAKEYPALHAVPLGVAVDIQVLNAHHLGHKSNQKPESVTKQRLV